jgi:hypothetical protein
LQVLADTDPSKEAKLKEHVKAWPLEAKPLADSASSLGGKSRTPSPAKTFIPVGHISLNSESEEFAELSSYKIAYFYVSSALRSSGLGRAAMDITEKTAISEPLCAKSLWLCTSSNVQQDPLVKVNKDKSTRVRETYYWTGSLANRFEQLLTEDWYARRGYAVFHHQPRKWSSIAYDGVERWTDAVYMRKYIT